MSSRKWGFPTTATLSQWRARLSSFRPKTAVLARRFLPQAAVYLKRPGAANIIDSIVEEQMILHHRDMIENHLSLALTRLCCQLSPLRKLESKFNVCLFVTLGSPLASVAVKKILPIPRVKPQNVVTWINAADQRDFVALRPKLTETNFGTAEIENLADVVNRNDDRHSISGYLNNGTVSKIIWQAITTQSSQPRQ